MNSAHNSFINERHPTMTHTLGIPDTDAAQAMPKTTLLLPLTVTIMAGVIQVVLAHKPETLQWAAALITVVYCFMAAYALNDRPRFFHHLCLTTSLGIVLAGALLLWQLATVTSDNSITFLTAVSLVLIWIYMLSNLGFHLTVLMGWTLSFLAVLVVMATCEAAVNVHTNGLTLLLAANLIGMGSLKNRGQHTTHLASIIHSLHEKATTDAVTGLYNRRHFVELAEREYSKAKRLEKPISILLIDIDHFKAINDQYGHQAGDRVLCRLADCLTENTREINICGRYGDDEFAILLTDSNQSAALEVAHRILNCINGTKQNQNASKNEHQFGISIGIGSSPRLAADCPLDNFTHHADQALYAAKKEGRNRVNIFKAC